MAVAQGLLDLPLLRSARGDASVDETDRTYCTAELRSLVPPRIQTSEEIRGRRRYRNLPSIPMVATQDPDRMKNGEKSSTT